MKSNGLTKLLLKAIRPLGGGWVPSLQTQSKKFKVDPIIERLWPLDSKRFSIAKMRLWSRAEMKSRLSGDKWMDNLILNKWEFATGATKLESCPWRFSVPFVLCNAKCEFCSAWLVTAKPMSIDIIDKLENLMPYLVEVDMVGWGEPLIHPELDRILEKFRDGLDRRARISLTTNGVRLIQWVDRLIDANVKDYAISLHASRPATHQDVMGLPEGSFERVLVGLEKLCSLKRQDDRITIQLVFIVMKQNIEEIPEFIQLGKRLGVSKIFFRTLRPRSVDEQRGAALDYHRLPPYLHPNFEDFRARAIDAIEAEKKIQIEASPATWSTPIFPVEYEDEILRSPVTPREVRQANKALRNESISDDGCLPKGELLLDVIASAESSALIQNGTPDQGPYNRSAPLLCPSPYTAFYINGFSKHVTPCCYMTQVPGYNMMYLGKTAKFDEIWNSAAMQELRMRLNSGPLKAQCMKCPFYW